MILIWFASFAAAGQSAAQLGEFQKFEAERKQHYEELVRAVGESRARLNQQERELRAERQKLSEQHIAGQSVREQHFLSLNPNGVFSFRLEVDSAFVMMLSIGEPNQPSERVDFYGERVLVEDGTTLVQTEGLEHECSVGCVLLVKPKSLITLKSNFALELAVKVEVEYENVARPQDGKLSRDQFNSCAQDFHAGKENLRLDLEQNHRLLIASDHLRERMADHQYRLLLLSILECVLAIILSWLQYRAVRSLFRHSIL